MSFYEKSREDNTRIHVSRSRGHAYPSHFHQNIEIFILKDGEYSMTVNGVEHCVSSGDIVFCDSYDVHEYREISGHRDDCVIVVPFRLLDKFNNTRQSMRLITNVIHSNELCEQLLEIVDKYINNEESPAVADSAVQLLLSIISDRLEFSKSAKHDDGDLIRKILTYIQNNFKKPISRAEIASALGYTEAHISRVFHKYMHTGIRKHINKVRMEYLEALRLEGDKRSELELLYDAGFGSEQTYYRYKAIKRKEL